MDNNAAPGDYKGVRSAVLLHFSNTLKLLLLVVCLDVNIGGVKE